MIRVNATASCQPGLEHSTIGKVQRRLEAIDVDTFDGFHLHKCRGGMGWHCCMFACAHYTACTPTVRTSRNSHIFGSQSSVVPSDRAAGLQHIVQWTAHNIVDYGSLIHLHSTSPYVRARYIRRLETED